MISVLAFLTKISAERTVQLYLIYIDITEVWKTAKIYQIQNPLLNLFMFPIKPFILTLRLILFNPITSTL